MQSRGGLGQSGLRIMRSTNVRPSLGTANERKGEASDSASRQLCGKGPHPCHRDTKMGDHSGQALPRFLPEDGEVPVLPGESPGSQHGGMYEVLSTGAASLLPSEPLAASPLRECVSKAVF